MLSRRTFLASAAASLSLPAMAQAAQELVLAFIPQESPDKLLGDIREITGWLSTQMGIPVRGFVTFDHAAAVEALRNGDADISFMGALPYVLAKREIGARIILSEVYRGSPVYTGRVFVRRDSGIKTPADLRDSGTIEQDADVILSLYRREVYEDDPVEKAKYARDAELIIGKQRNGPTDTVNLEWTAHTTTFSDPEYHGR